MDINILTAHIIVVKLGMDHLPKLPLDHCCASDVESTATVVGKTHLGGSDIDPGFTFDFFDETCNKVSVNDDQ